MPAPFGLRPTLGAALFLGAAIANAASLAAAGYTESFDTMGVSGTAPPDGWALFTGPAGTSNSTWTSSIPAAGVAAMVTTAGALTATNAPTATNNNGYNAAATAGTPGDRVLATSPTTVSGSALQLTLSNDTGALLSGLNISYDTVRFTTATTANELPGYWLFYSLDGSNWVNVAALNSGLADVPNSVGVSSSSASFDFATPVAAGASFRLRWVDDNAQQTSPDQILGLNNLSISAVPEPASVALWLTGLIAVVGAARRKSRG
jgi:hypothetical protein